MKKRFLSVLLVLCLLMVLASPSMKTGFTSNAASTEDKDNKEKPSKDDYDGTLRIEDGRLMPMLQYSDLLADDYSNKDSDILRFCVYVETDYDTDNDGVADLVKALVQVPKGAVEGKYKAGTIYDPTPYSAGVVQDFYLDASPAYLEKSFDYKKLYTKGKKRKSSDTMTAMEAAEAAMPGKDWNYQVPRWERKGYYDANKYAYYLVRGYAVVQAGGIGTYGSEGYELCGRDIERDSHKCIIEWLAGDRVAYTDAVNNIQIKADWSNGNVAMIGVSYGGTLCYEVATTGVNGLKTIIPYAGIASWYDYTNSQGISLFSIKGYANLLAAFNCGGVFLDDDWTVLDDGYRSWLWQISEDESKTKGNYAPIWEESDFFYDYQKINCTALIVQGLNDFNVTTRHAFLMYDAFKKAKKPVKLFLHQNGHANLNSFTVNGELWLEVQNKWLAHYLYDVDNGIEDMPEITVQSNVSGKLKEYDSFGEYREEKVSFEKSEDITEVSSDGLLNYTLDCVANNKFSFDTKEDYFLGIDEKNAALIDIDVPEGATILGIPEIHLKLSTDAGGTEPRMVTAVLIDTVDDGEFFKAYMTKNVLGDTLPMKTIEEIDQGGDLPPLEIKEFVQSTVNAKCFSLGWMDLANPDCGPDQSEYTENVDLKSGKYYDYNLYMLPTVYTVEKGHHLKLLLTTWHAYTSFVDQDNKIQEAYIKNKMETPYSYFIDNSSVKVRLPIAGK